MGYFEDKISDRAKVLEESITHGTAARARKLNEGKTEEQRIIDLSIGSLDEPASQKIDEYVIAQLSQEETRRDVHAFTPVEGLLDLRRAIAAEAARNRNLIYNPEDKNPEIIVTPGGIKGSLNLAMQALVNPGDEVAVFVPNWPHYKGLVQNVSGTLKQVAPAHPEKTFRITPDELDNAITGKTKVLIFGDLINPTGIKYSEAELQKFANVLAKPENRHVTVFYDCPYPRLAPLPPSFASLAGVDPDGHEHPMRERTLCFFGPGKMYGMHGDRIGYVLAPAEAVERMKTLQGNTTSFASNQSQYATIRALQKDLDGEIKRRAELSRANCLRVMDQLKRAPGLHVDAPEDGYFLFVNVKGLRVPDPAEFFLRAARVAVINGREFGVPGFVRINCGRDRATLDKACHRIISACEEHATGQPVSKLKAMAGAAYGPKR